MRIWFDISNAPHVNLFSPLIEELKDAHEIVITTRPLSNTIDLLDKKRLAYDVVGSHYGAHVVLKLLGYPIRVVNLYRFLRSRNIDVAISQSSFHSPVVAKLLGIRSIYMNDNEHALGNIPSFLCADTVLIPEYFEKKKAYRQGASRKKLVQYPGVKEGIYLWQLLANRPTTKTSRSAKTVFFRPEPLTAQYYRGPLYFFDDQLKKLQEYAKVVVLPRTKQQGEHYEALNLAGIHVSRTPMEVEEINGECGLFIGAGGTMTREMAVLGVPTVSIYKGDALDVDRYLINQGLMDFLPDPSVPALIELLKRGRTRDPAMDLLRKGRETYNLIKRLLLKE